MELEGICMINQSHFLHLIAEENEVDWCEVSHPKTRSQSATGLEIIFLTLDRANH